MTRRGWPSKFARSSVSKAGISKAVPIADYTVETLDQQFASNVRGPFFLAQQLLPIRKLGSWRPMGEQPRAAKSELLSRNPLRVHNRFVVPRAVFDRNADGRRSRHRLLGKVDRRTLARLWGVTPARVPGTRPNRPQRHARSKKTEAKGHHRVYKQSPEPMPCCVLQNITVRFC